ncbi:hypothetical protein SAMN02910317_01997 [Ruminococcaceae bacterium FB2012]|nr:hypothetical protein SAMN02910317_01997 [Ruminococcaceae bacterium FB2012]
MNISKRLKKFGVTYWMIAAILLFLLIATIGVYAAYTGDSDLKRTVSTKSSSTVVFSSNVMKSPASEKNIHHDSATSEYDYYVTVCNFDQMSPASHAKQQISYDLTAELGTYDGTTFVPLTEEILRNDGVTKKVFKILKVGDNNSEMIGSENDLNSSTNHFRCIYENETLPATTSFTDKFKLIFDREEFLNDNPEYYICVTATPSNSSAVTGTVIELKAYISASKSQNYDANWSGSLIEIDNSDYDAYNMQVTGSGKGVLEIKWNSQYFSISDMFLMDSANEFVDESNVAVTGNSAILNDSTANWKKIRLKVDSYNKQNKYNIQFFKEQEHTFTSSDKVSNYIKSGTYTPDTY